MDPFLLVANFKSHKTAEEVAEWLNEVGPTLHSADQIEIVVCPQDIALARAYEVVREHDWQNVLKLGIQDISAYGEGAFTGEVEAGAANAFVAYAIVGHSERRQLFHETAEDVRKKVKQAIESGIKPIICESDETMSELASIAEPNVVVAYEPPSAIGTGKPAEMTAVTQAVGKIDQLLTSPKTILYGGSVDDQYVEDLLRVPKLNGFLIGTASLDAASFLKVYHAVRQYRQA